MTTSFSRDRFYQTRDGRHARYIAPTHFQVQLSGFRYGEDKGWFNAIRNEDGTYLDTHAPHDFDIVPITASADELCIMHKMAEAKHDDFIILIRELRA